MHAKKRAIFHHPICSTFYNIWKLLNMSMFGIVIFSIISALWLKKKNNSWPCLVLDFGQKHTPKQKFSVTSLPDITVSGAQIFVLKNSKDKKLENRLLCEGKKHLFKKISSKKENIVHKTHVNPNVFFNIRIALPENCLSAQIENTVRACFWAFHDPQEVEL